MSRERDTHAETTYDTRRGGLLRFLHSRPEQKKGVTYYELDKTEGDPFKHASENLRYFVGGEHIPFGNNYRMLLRRSRIGLMALPGYQAFIDLREGRITEKQFVEKKAKVMETVEANAKIRHLHKKNEADFRRRGSTISYKYATTSIEVCGDIANVDIVDIARLLAGLNIPYDPQPKKETAPTPSFNILEPSFGEEDYSYVGYQSASRRARPEDSDANRLFGEYVQAAEKALRTDHEDPQLDHARATLAATHRLRNDLVKYKRTRKGMLAAEVLIESGQKRKR